jgi:formylglycine-generating enzyme required for sulfatase activity
MKPIWRIILGIGLAAAGVTAYWWLGPFLRWVEPNANVIQGVDGLISIVCAVGGLVVAVWGWRDRAAPPARTEESQINMGDGTIVRGDVNTGDDFVGRDKNVLGGENSPVIKNDGVVNIYQGTSTQVETLPPDEPLSAVRDQYLRFIVDKHRYLSFRGFGPSDTIEMKVELAELYVPLKARRELSRGSETWSAEVRLAGRKLEEAQEKELRLSQPTAVLDLLRENDGLVLLGDPGAGKSTFLKFLAVRVAAGQGQALGLKGCLPALVPLAAYANALEQGDRRLDQFIETYFCDTCDDLRVGAVLREALKAGEALILLDGLDEVKDLGLRHTVIDRVLNYYNLHRKAGNKFVLTSRVVGYREVRPAAEGLVEATLVDFEDEEIAEFAAKWTAVIERQAKGDSRSSRLDAEQERRELLEAVRGSEGVRRLAANPLLLTILAVMKRQGVSLPERRVELYEQYVKTLISTWNRARSLGGRAVGRDLDTLTTIRLLAPLALWMHETNPGVGLVKREDLLRRLQALYAARGEVDTEGKAIGFLADVHEHTSLLLERGPGQYGFIHLTFEEYLAGVGIAFQSQGLAEKIYAELAKHVGEPAWREVGLLAVGYVGLIQQLPSVAGQVLERLVTEHPGLPGQAVVFAGEVAVDARPDGVEKASQDMVIAALVETMQSASVANAQRRQAGMALGRLGWCPPDLDQFVEIKPGPFLYGNKKEKREIRDPYWIAKYPVTYQQYADFIAEGGYTTHEWWSNAGWAWREKRQRSQPQHWDNNNLHNPIFPVVGVSAYEAEAYAAWLTCKLKTAGRMQKGCMACLPSEEEWERAARGTDGREYPWGGDFRFDVANTREQSAENQKAGGTTAVCTYPQGVSLIGAWDMSGNVLEWTYSIKGGDYVLRGGSWALSRWTALCAFRYGRAPDYFYNNPGFRVVLSRALEQSR